MSFSSQPQLKAEVLKKLQISETELDSFFGLKDNLKFIKLSEPSDRAIVYTNGNEPYFFDATGECSRGYVRVISFNPAFHICVAIHVTTQPCPRLAVLVPL